MAALCLTLRGTAKPGSRLYYRKIYNSVKFTILSIFELLFGGVKYAHPVVQLSAPSIPRTFLPPQTETLSP